MLPEPSSSAAGVVARVYWWGFHIQISHDDLERILSAADVSGTMIAALHGEIPGPAAPFVGLAAAFVASTHDRVRSLDRGRGVYISMAWIAPSVFVPTSV